MNGDTASKADLAKLEGRVNTAEALVGIGREISTLKGRIDTVETKVDAGFHRVDEKLDAIAAENRDKTEGRRWVTNTLITLAVALAALVGRVSQPVYEWFVADEGVSGGAEVAAPTGDQPKPARP